METVRNFAFSDMVTRAGLKGRGSGSIFTGGPQWRNLWRHRL